MQEKSVLTGHLSELKQKIENGLEELKSSKDCMNLRASIWKERKVRSAG